MSRRSLWLVLLSVSVASALGGALDVPMAPGLVSVKVLLGTKGTEPSTWEGSYRLTQGRIIATDGWRFARSDYATVERFKLGVRRNFPLFWRLRGQDPNKMPTAPNGFILTLEGVTPESVLEVTTSNGNFSVPVGKLGYGQFRPFLGGNAQVERVPDAERPNTPDTQMFYRYLAQFDGLCASHTSGTDMGTDWRDMDPKVERVEVTVNNGELVWASPMWITYKP